MTEYEPGPFLYLRSKAKGGTVVKNLNSIHLSIIVSVPRTFMWEFIIAS